MNTLPILLILTPAAALAASPFDGTWTIRPGSYHGSDKPYVFVVDQNEYQCDCTPPVSVKPDGRFHEVTGHAYDSTAVKIINPRTIEVIDRKGGKELARETFAASPGNEHLRVRVVDESGEKPNTMHFMLKRSAGTKPELGKHPVSGSWVIMDMREARPVPITLKMTHDSFSWSMNGQHYQAKLNGEPVAIGGDPTHTMAAVRKLDANEVQETDTRNGQAVDETVFAVSTDGKSIKVTDTDPRSGRVSHYLLDRGS